MWAFKSASNPVCLRCPLCQLRQSELKPVRVNLQRREAYHDGAHLGLCIIDAALEVGCDISNGIAGSQSTPQRADELADGRELLPKRVVYLPAVLTPLLVGEPRDLTFQVGALAQVRANAG